MRKLYTLAMIALMLAVNSCNNNQAKDSGNTATAKKDSTNTAVTKTILFFGNSLTAGYGLDVTEAFPALIQARLDSLKLPYKVINAGLSGETSAGGKARIGWLLRQNVDIFVLELGANDGLRGIPVKETISNLQDIIDSVRTKNPATKMIMAGMQIPPNMGSTYTNEFKGIFGDLAKKNNMQLLPFILEGVGGVPELNQGDGIHPTVEGHRIVAENVWAVLKDML
jgi:acyl-CoA thioesterase I